MSVLWRNIFRVVNNNNRERKIWSCASGWGLKYPVVCQHYGYWFYFSTSALLYCSPMFSVIRLPFLLSWFKIFSFELPSPFFKNKNFCPCFVSSTSNQSSIAGDSKASIWCFRPRVKQSKLNRVNTIGNRSLKFFSKAHQFVQKFEIMSVAGRAAEGRG